MSVSTNHEYGKLNVKTAPTSEPVTTSEVKTAGRIDTTEFDALIDELITGARKAMEAKTHRTFLTTTYEMYLDRWYDVIELMRPPVQSVGSVEYKDNDGNFVTINADDYFVDTYADPPTINPLDFWPTIGELDERNRVRITYDAGYGDASDVPQQIKAAIKAIVIDMFEHPEKSPEETLYTNRTVDMLLASVQRPYL